MFKNGTFGSFFGCLNLHIRIRREPASRSRRGGSQGAEFFRSGDARAGWFYWEKRRNSR